MYPRNACEFGLGPERCSDVVSKFLRYKSCYETYKIEPGLFHVKRKALRGWGLKTCLFYSKEKGIP